MAIPIWIVVLFWLGVVLGPVTALMGYSTAASVGSVLFAVVFVGEVIWVAVRMRRGGRLL